MDTGMFFPVKKSGTVRLLPALLPEICISAAGYAQGDLNVCGYGQYCGDMSSSLYRHLAGEASGQLEARRVEVAALKTPDD